MHEYQDSEAIAHPKVLFAVSRYDGNTHKTPDCFSTIDKEVKNIDKNTWRTIYKSINAPYFGEVKLFTKYFNDQCKKRQNKTQNIPPDIK